MIRISIIVFIALLFAGCGPEEKTKEDYLDDIDEAEAAFEQDYENDEVMRSRALGAARAYTAYVQRFPEDSARIPDLMSKAILAYAHGEQWDSSLMWIDTIRIQYPETEQSVNMLHFKGYIYEEGKKDFDKAEEVYLNFIEEYPQHELVPAVLFSLENLGKTDKELMDAIREKNTPDQYP